VFVIVKELSETRHTGKVNPGLASMRTFSLEERSLKRQQGWILCKTVPEGLRHGTRAGANFYYHQFTVHLKWVSTNAR
jgi:hypothetical protein